MATLAQVEAKCKWDGVAHKEASAAALPSGTGDGYGFGGGAIVVIGKFAILVGEGPHSHALADEIARRWNHTANVCAHEFTNGALLPEGGMKAVCKHCGFVATTKR